MSSKEYHKRAKQKPEDRITRTTIYLKASDFKELNEKLKECKLSFSAWVRRQIKTFLGLPVDPDVKEFYRELTPAQKRGEETISIEVEDE